MIIKDPCEVCKEQEVFELFARIGGRTLGKQRDCGNCNVKGLVKDGEDEEAGGMSSGF